MTKGIELCSDVTVVIRSAGERTEKLCEQLVLKQVPAKHVVVIHERPFNKALQVGFEIGLDCGLQWTLCLDADTLLSKKAIPRLLTLASELEENILGIQTRALDKFFGGDRKAGYHLYRTSLLDRARTMIPNPDKSARPETYVKREMVARGHTWYFKQDVLAIHDYEQFYGDIFRKMVVQARKFRRVIPYLMSRAISLIDDPDYRVAAQGLCNGLSIEGKEILELDYTTWEPEAESVLKECGIKEKMLLNIDDYIDYPYKLLSSYVQSEAYKDFLSKYMPRSITLKKLPLPVQHRNRLLELGPVRSVPWIFGIFFQLVGSRLVSWSSVDLVTKK